MFLICQKYVFNMDDINYVSEYDKDHIRITYKNGDYLVFSISFEEFYKELQTKHVI